MRFRQIALALFACLALGAFAANAAQAAEGEGWTIGTTENQTTGGTLLSGTETVTCQKHGTSSLVITSTLLGSPIELTAEGVECVEASIDNTTEKGHSKGKFKFKGVKVKKPAHCSVSGEELTTEELSTKAKMDPTPSSKVWLRRLTNAVMTIKTIIKVIKILGAECALAESEVSLNGSLCGEVVHTNAGGTGFESTPTGTLTKIQTSLFGAAQQSTGNSTEAPCALTLGTQEAQFSGAIDYELAGSNAGKPFGAD